MALKRNADSFPLSLPKKVHNHIIWNSTTLDCKHKFRDFFRSGRAVRKLSDLICAEHNLSVIEKPHGKGKPYNIWQGLKPKPSHREQICNAIDDALTKAPATFEELLSLLSAAGCEIKSCKNLSIRIDKNHRFARLDTLGPGYSAVELRAIIAGTKKMPERKKKRKENHVDLLIDIQAKMQEGKGAGYERWAKSFNLKQMSETVLYLKENGLLDYIDLTKKAEAASDRFHELSAEIKAAEQRMTELSMMKKHIINYSKTRDTYVAYRKAGYSKKCLAEHESDILLHKAAKKYFDDVGIKSFPSMKSIDDEFAELLVKKKAAYSEYREARDEMKELHTVKANVDRILEIKEETNEKEKPSTNRF